ncbi:cytochrome p450 [Zalerion maritima]|uniref:Cytochrome p450 n=1 Tax=Zalerion maritima TaxID=339359 RepID=A0AAD5RR03_9PEZI|nr:cytochrome p450 [Zalerion maritima]
MLDLLLGKTAFLACILALLAIGYGTAHFTREARIRRTGGVRATKLAGNPITGFCKFLKAGRAQSNNQLLEFHQGLFSYPPGSATSPSSTPNVREISLLPGRGYRFVLTREPAHIKTILTSKFSDFGKGPDFHRLWRPFLGDSIFTTDGEMWKESRALIRGMFVKERVEDLVVFNRWTELLLRKMERGDVLTPGTGVDGGWEVDVGDLFYRLTLDVTTDYLLGRGVGCLENPEHKFAKAFNEVQRIQMLLTVLAPFEKLISRKEYNASIKTIESFVEPFIQTVLSLPPQGSSSSSPYSSTPPTASAIADSFLLRLSRLTRDPRVIRDQLMSILLAGRDTTAATLTWLYFHLSQRPDVYSRLRKCVLDSVGPEGSPTYANLKDLKPLDAAISETLRMYPAVPFNVRTALTDTTLSPPEGKGGGKEKEIAVLEGDCVVYSTIAMQRRWDIYDEYGAAAAGGKGVAEFGDPGVWEPARWENGWAPKPWTYVPFNGGPRICVGLGFAKTEMMFVLVRLLQRYERIECRGDWQNQYHKSEVVGTPGLPVRVAFFDAKN